MKSLQTHILHMVLAFSPVLLPAAPSEPLEVGDSIPSGTLFTESGEAFQLAEKVIGTPTVLIFYRGGWCPYCNRHLSALVDIDQDLAEAGFQLLAISPDRPEVLRRKESMEALSYKLLSDSSMEVTSSFGIAFKVEEKLVNRYRNSHGIDLEGDSGQTHHLLPHPSVYVVDAEGIIRFTYVNENHKVRLDAGKILAAAKAFSVK